MKYTDQIIKLVTAALLAAMTCVATMVIQIPSGNEGYIHPGDAFVILSGIILGPIYGGFSAGIGSSLADLLSGYAVYALPTFIIKFLAALTASYTYRYLRKFSVIIAGVLASFVVTFGYFLYDLIVSGTFMTAILDIPFNLLQNTVGIILASIILPLLMKVPQVKTMVKAHKTSI